MPKLLKIFFFILFAVSAQQYSVAQTTGLQGVIKDSVTSIPLPFATIKFDNTSIGIFSDDNGKFFIRNRADRNQITVSLIGYKHFHLTIPVGKISTQTILLQPEDLSLNEIVVKPKKEKYSKKDNPAVALIKNVIAHKDSNNVRGTDFYQCREYDRILFAINDFNPEQGAFKKMKFLPNYIDTSIIDNRPILPFSVRESVGEFYYRRSPKSEKRVLEAFDRSGIDNEMDLKGLESVINEVFKDISIYDNSMTFMIQEFISPLSSSNSVNFYKWYITDTVSIDKSKFIELAFTPFNSRDIGLTGYLYIATDGSYGVKRAEMRVPRNINMNFVDEMIIRHEFEQTASGKWIPTNQRVAIDLSLYKTIKFHVDKTRILDKYEYGLRADSIYKAPAPVTFAADYENKSPDYWSANRPAKFKDYRMDEMMHDIRNIPFLNFMINAGTMVADGYFHTTKDPKKSKIDIGTLLTFYSYNSIEGNRIRGTLSTTPALNDRLFFYGYGAYGTRDNRFKYYGETTWSFRKIKEHKDEFPRNTLTVAYKYDINDLGQRYTQSERDYIFMSLRSSPNDKSTYNRQTQISYNQEYYNGISYKISAQTFDEKPAGKLLFRRFDGENIVNEKSIKSTEAKVELRFAPHEKFFQRKRKRYPIPSERIILNLTHTSSLKGVLGGKYNYNKAEFLFIGEKWVAPFGKIMTRVNAQQLWGKAPFPMLITPDANSSLTLQDGDFSLLEPLEFIHDKQVSWAVDYHMGGWLFNRIPLINKLKLREVFGFKGVMGDLGNRNNPKYNQDLLLFPHGAYQADKTPYMEYNIGIENFLSFFRLDYVRRINYKNHPNVSNSGFRFTVDFTF